MNVRGRSLFFSLLIISAFGVGTLTAGLAFAENPDAADAERIYAETCSVCHGAGVGGAPRPDNSSDWAPRVAAGVEDLYYNTIDGLGSMPAKGTCMGCTEDELKAVVDFMIQDLEIR